MLLIEEFPDFEHIFQVIPRHFVKVTLLSGQLLLILLLQDLEVKTQEPLDFGSVFSLQAIDVVEEILECLQQPLVKLGPIGREILLHENACDPNQLVVGVIPEDTLLWILDERQ